MKTIIAILLLLILGSCELKERWNYKEIIYFKDTRTGLCFASVLTNTAISITYVPCDSVKHLLK